MQGYGSPQQQHPYGSPAPGYQQAPPPQGYQQQGYQQQQQSAYQQGAYGMHNHPTVTTTTSTRLAYRHSCCCPKYWVGNEEQRMS